MTSNIDKAQIVARAGELARGYKQAGFHCSEAVVRAVPEALGFDIPADVVRAACGFFGGGGGTGGRCGVVESGIIVISFLYGLMHVSQSTDKAKTVIRALIREFKQKFGDLECRNVKAAAVAEHGPEFGCEDVYAHGAELITGILLDCDEI